MVVKVDDYKSLLSTRNSEAELTQIKIAIITSHPIQYQAPLFRALANDPNFDLTVFFGSRHGVDTNSYDYDFGRQFKWDIPLLAGYKHVFLKNSRPNIHVSSWRLDGPELKDIFRNEAFGAILTLGWNKVLFWQAIWWGQRSGAALYLRAESNLLHHQPWWVKAAKAILFPMLFRQFRAFLAIGKFNRELYHHYGVPEENVFMAPYCVDNDFFARNSSKQRKNAEILRQNLGISNDQTVFLFAAKFINRKRPLDIIQTAKLINRQDLHVIMVGDGPLLPKCRELIGRNGLNNIHLLGFKNQSELPLYYAAADVLILPSEFETWGLVINEAMACGLPCIVSDGCSAAADMIIEGETGYIYPVGDINRLATLMAKIAENKKKLKEMSSHAANYITNFDMQHVVSALKEAISQTKI